MINGVLAKHGYTVDWGFFNGTCTGAEVKPLEHEKTLTESIIKQLRAQALINDKRAADLKSGAVEPVWFNRTRDAVTRKYVDTNCSRADLDDYSAQQQTIAATYRAENTAKHERSHAAMLEKLIVSRHGKALMPVSTKRELSVGDRLLLGGKSGIICEVVEIKMHVASGCGPYMNGHTMLHAFVKRPDGRVIAVPTRTIRQSAIIEETQS
jgi:hypothetical protein